MILRRARTVGVTAWSDPTLRPRFASDSDRDKTQRRQAPRPTLITLVNDSTGDAGKFGLPAKRA